VPDNNPAHHIRLLPVIKDKVNNQLIPGGNLLPACMAETYAAEREIDNPAVTRHLGGISILAQICYLAEKTLKIRLFPISFPEIQISGKGLPANAFYLQGVLLVLELGHRHMFHCPAMGAVEQGHTFLIDKNLGLTHAKSSFIQQSLPLSSFAIMTEYCHDVDM
jgi:hypothetical protein